MSFLSRPESIQMVLSVFYFIVQFVIPLGLYHTITVEKVIDINVHKADCTGGKGACPPEDCGGPHGYNHLKQILVTPKHPEYESMKEWIGLEPDEDWDAEYFDLEEVQEAVREI